MKEILNAKNAKMAGAATTAGYLAYWLTKKESGLVTGLAMFIAIGVTLPFAAKL